MSNAVELILRKRIVAILRLDDLTHAVELSRALLAGGIVAQEFTMTNPQALDAVAKVRASSDDFENGNAVVGVGSVRSLAEADAAIAAGAQFLVTPTLRLDVIQCAVAHGVPIIPGAFTPTEIATAWDAGAAVVKVFPARQLGPEFIKDVLAPMPYLKLMPTGGVNLNNMQQYFRNGAVVVGIGNQLLDLQAVNEGNWKRITAIAREYAAHALDTTTQVSQEVTA